ncbi:MAG: amidophosphoribosyltransferase [Planctomycetaceae bacterium]|nr:amidophosphoribosyltransferase [Planctomycetaceae bacterium]
MADLFHECGIAAIYHYGDERSSVLKSVPPEKASRLMPRMLLDIQNRGQLAAGMTTYRPNDTELLRTHKNVGSVTEVFRLNHKAKYNNIMREHEGYAAIGHVRYATCGKDDKRYAQPFERSHLEKRKWFSFGFNGQLANYTELRDEIRSQGDFHLARETDTETLMHLISQEISQQERGVNLPQLLRNVYARLDGACNIVFLNSVGDMFVSRDALGFRPLCYADRDGCFAAASESVALSNLGFAPEEIHDLEPGHAIIIQKGVLQKIRFAEPHKLAHCFFEWIYFANVCSRLDDQSVYMTRKRLGEELAAQELARPVVDVANDESVIVVPVPDTAKAAAEGMAFDLKRPCLEGLMRHRALGRTFIEGEDREDKARMKYIPLPEVLEGKKIFLVDDTIVRSTTMKVLIDQLRSKGKASEVHVRIACPPIMAPCFYGIDMSEIGELFAPEFASPGVPIGQAEEDRMAAALGADSLRYLPIEAISRSVGRPESQLCQACLTGNYPTPAGNKLYGRCLEKAAERKARGETGSRNSRQRMIEDDESVPLIPARL